MSISPLPGAQRVIKTPLCLRVGGRKPPGFQLTDAFKRGTTNKKWTKKSPHVGESETVLILNSRLWIPKFRCCIEARDSGFHKENFPRSGFHRQKFSVFRNLACGQALLFGRVKRVSRERASERPSREGIGELARRLSGIRIPKHGATKTSTVQTLQEASNAVFSFVCF